MIKDHGIFSMVIILLILITLSLHSVSILLGKNFCWSVSALYKGLIILECHCSIKHNMGIKNTFTITSQKASETKLYS